jgi:hypothetical protein
MECFDLEDKINRVILNESGNQILNALGGMIRRGVNSVLGRGEQNQTQKIRELFNYKFDQRSREVLGSKWKFYSPNTLGGIKIYDVYLLTLNIFNDIINQIRSEKFENAMKPIMSGIKKEYKNEIDRARKRKGGTPKYDREFEYSEDMTINEFKEKIFKIINFNYKGISDSDANLTANDDPEYNLTRDLAEEKENFIKILKMFSLLKEKNNYISYRKAINKILAVSKNNEKIIDIMKHMFSDFSKKLDGKKLDKIIDIETITAWMRKNYNVTIIYPVGS